MLHNIIQLYRELGLLVFFYIIFMSNNSIVLTGLFARKWEHVQHEKKYEQ